MKKVLLWLGFLLCLLLLLSAAAFAEEETETRTPDGQYNFHNATDLVVTKITLINNADVDNVLAIEPEGGLQPDDVSGEVGVFLKEGDDGKAGFTLMIEFADGQISIFDSLHYEKVMIEILTPVDANSGATPIAFVAERQMGYYWIVNATGGVVKDLTISHNGNGEKTKMESELPDGGEIGIGFTIAADEDPEHCLTLSFTREDGTEQKFETLSIERVTITLLSPDAVTGATQQNPIKISAYVEE